MFARRMLRSSALRVLRVQKRAGHVRLLTTSDPTSRTVEQLSDELLGKLAGNEATGEDGDENASDATLADIRSRRGAANLQVKSQDDYEALLDKMFSRAVTSWKEREGGAWAEASFDNEQEDPFEFYTREVNKSWAMKKCFFSYHGLEHLHYTNTPLLNMFVSKLGNILPRTQTYLTAKMQRKLARTIKTSRQAGLMPYKGTWNSLRTGPFTPENRRFVRRELDLGSLPSIEPNPEDDLGIVEQKTLDQQIDAEVQQSRQ